jgi:cell division septal protein FtsQ
VAPERSHRRSRCRGACRRGLVLLSLSPAQVAGAIEQVPTIRVASVDRDFPHTLRIHIVPERAVALAVGPGHYPQSRRG